MVYQSDFYTTRRPYTRPISTSYSVTPLHSSIVPTYSTLQVRALYPPLPYVAHKRLVYVIHTPINTVYHTGTYVPIRIHSRLRPSIIRAELNRIRDRLRPSFVSYTNNYLNSKDNIYFDDEARDIRARADSLLRRIHVFIPRLSPSDYAEEIIPERLRSDDYIRRLLSARNNQKKEIDGLSWYLTPELRHMGDGTLACVKYIGGRPQSRRRPYYTVADLRPGDVKSDVNLLSFYLKNRQAAANATPDEPLTERELRKERALAMDPPKQKPKKVVEPEPEIEPEIQPEPKLEPELEPEPEPEQVIESELEEVVHDKKEKKDKKQKEKEVKKRLDEEALKRAEEFLARKAEEARLEEERQKKAEEERLRLEKEAEEARLALEKAEEERRLAEILEQERLEAIRKVEEAKAEAARQEAERIATEERRLLNLRRIYAEAIATTIAEEEDRIIQEKNLENLRRQEEEERLIHDDVIPNIVDEYNRTDEYVSDQSRQPDLSDQEKEEQSEVVVEEESKVEEDVQTLGELEDGGNEAPVEGGDAAEVEEISVSIEEAPIVEEVETVDHEEAPQVDEVSSADHEEMAQVEEVSSADHEEILQIEEVSSADHEEMPQVEEVSSAVHEEMSQVEEVSSADHEEADIPNEEVEEEA